MHNRNAYPPPPPSGRAEQAGSPWALVVGEIALTHPEMGQILGRARAETVGGLGESQVWQVALAPLDTASLAWMQERAAPLLTRKLQSVLRRAVLVDVVLPETEVA